MGVPPRSPGRVQHRVALARRFAGDERAFMVGLQLARYEPAREDRALHISGRDQVPPGPNADDVSAERGDHDRYLPLRGAHERLHVLVCPVDFTSRSRMAGS